MKILIVDDDREDADVLYEAVKGVAPMSDCRIVHSALDAQTTVEHFIPHFVFLDAIMYPVDGKETLRHLSQKPALKETFFIVMTGISLPEQHTIFTALGAKVVMTKPSHYSSLLSFVQHILEPCIINQRAKLYTNESLIHDQTASIENLLNRAMDFEISLNEPMRQHIQFLASEKELASIKSELGYNLQLLKGGHWLPHI
ncbi:MAG TPA: response regulator [Chryseosolibacter sp.]